MIPDSVQADLLGNDLEGITPDVAPVLLKIAVPLYRKPLCGRRSAELCG